MARILRTYSAVFLPLLTVHFTMSLRQLGGQVVNLNQMWNYAAGIAPPTTTILPTWFKALFRRAQLYGWTPMESSHWP